MKIRKKNRLTFKQKKLRNENRLRRILPFSNFKDFYLDLLEKRRNSEVLKPHDNFELLKNTQEVIYFIELLKNYKNTNVIEIIIDLTDVKTIDIGAISLLLSSVKELSFKNKKVSGTVPKESSAYEFLLESGFFRNISNLSNGISQKMKNNLKCNQNLLLLGYPNTRGKGRLIGENIKHAMGLLTGTPQHYRPIYTLVMEMNANSIEHAYDKEIKHWIFGINYKKDENKLYFTFTDNGFGILEQLNIRVDKRIKQLFKDFSNTVLLKNLFDKKYNSRFKTQINRNLGLPIIQKQAINKTVQNLICITNNVYFELDTKNTLNLHSKFNGTFYYWELDLKLLQKNE